MAMNPGQALEHRRGHPGSGAGRDRLSAAHCGGDPAGDCAAGVRAARFTFTHDSTISRTRRLIDLETHRAVFTLAADVGQRPEAIRASARK